MTEESSLDQLIEDYPGWRQFAVATEGPPSAPPDCELP